LIRTEEAIPAQPALSDAEIIRRISHGDCASFETLMRRFNRKLFRIARAILKDDAEAEEALQEAYLAAYVALQTFRGQSKLSTWITRIVINESLGRLRKQKREETFVSAGEDSATEDADQSLLVERSASPEDAAFHSEIRELLEHRIDELPVAFRTVFMMRELEEMTVEETAVCLAIPEATVRTRLHRAKGLLRKSLAQDIHMAASDVFPFAGERCDRIVAAVLDRVAAIAARI
jgi:RNA polymerase sigma-70 factor (ECF subfamily)